MNEVMATCRLTSIVLACLALAAGWNNGWADSRGRDASRQKAAIADTREDSSRQEKRASHTARMRESLIKLVDEKFATWDQNRDGRLSADEVDRLIADPSVTGHEAAAVAAIHRYLRCEGNPTSITRRGLLTNAQQQIMHSENDGNQESAEGERDDSQPKFVSRYVRFSKHLEKAPRAVFTGKEAPTLEGIQQGALGDCYFMCVIGATVSRNPNTIRRMLRPNADGTTDVWFPGSKPFRVPRLTDSELALTSSAGDQGIWVNILEKALAKVKFAHPKTHESANDIDLDVMSRGGKIVSTIQLMTGHKAVEITIRKYNGKKYHQPARNEIPRLMTRLDTIFTKAFGANRLVCADIAPGVKGVDTPPGLNGKHAYAVLGYDRTTHTVTVWNPHGKDFTPKQSPPSPKNGYTVKGGVFEIPLRDFVRVFKAVNYETSATLTADTHQRRRGRA
jgi:hypothetical protein